MTNSQKNSKEIREKTQEKIKQLRSQTPGSFDLKHLEKGIETVLECYLVLKYGFIQSFFMIEEDIKIKKEMLNQNQVKESKKRKLFQRKKPDISSNFIPLLKEYDPKKNLSIGFFIFLLSELELKIGSLNESIEKAVPDVDDKKKIVALILYCDKLKNNLIQAVQLFDEGIYSLSDNTNYKLEKVDDKSL